MFIKTAFYDLKSKQLKIIKMQFLFEFPDIRKIAAFRWKDADVSRTQGLCQKIYTTLDLL